VFARTARESNLRQQIERCSEKNEMPDGQSLILKTEQSYGFVEVG
jgi:hypothetical protein